MPLNYLQVEADILNGATYPLCVDRKHVYALSGASVGLQLAPNLLPDVRAQTMNLHDQALRRQQRRLVRVAEHRERFPRFWAPTWNRSWGIEVCLRPDSAFDHRQ